MTRMAVLCEMPLSSRCEASRKFVAPPTTKSWLVPKSKSQKALVRTAWRTVQTGSEAEGAEETGPPR